MPHDSLDDNTPHAEAITRLWSRYRSAVHKQGFKPPFDRWVVIRAEQYVKAYPDKRLGDHGPEEVTAWLEALGRKADLKGWQFRQAVEALKILFSDVLTLKWSRDFDWNHWLASAKALEASHPTARGRRRR